MLCISPSISGNNCFLSTEERYQSIVKCHMGKSFLLSKRATKTVHFETCFFPPKYKTDYIYFQSMYYRGNWKLLFQGMELDTTRITIQWRLELVYILYLQLRQQEMPGVYHLG